MLLKEERRLFKEAQHLARQFYGLNGLRDVEVGLKYKDGELTDKISLRFKVIEKKTVPKLKRSEIIPKRVGKFSTDVLTHAICHQQYRIENSKSIIRPLLGGVQIQSGIYHNTNRGWGTVGCFFKVGDFVLGFTNYHVLYGSLNVSHEFVSNNYVDKLRVFQNMKSINTKIGTAANFFDSRLDYATFYLQTPYDQLQSINALHGVLTSYVYPQINTLVLKSGAATGITYGIIDGRSCIDCSELSIYINQQYHNPDNPISDHGDSGSAWLLHDNSSMLKPIALHYAGGGTLQWAKAKTFSSIFSSIRNKITNQNLLT